MRKLRYYNFVKRSQVLLDLENDYEDFVLSCRHRDILRCSKTRHFRSCYAPDGIYSANPYHLCSQPYFAIIGKKDKSGDWLWRAFVKVDTELRYSYNLNEKAKEHKYLYVYKIYGNAPIDITNKVVNTLKDKGIEVFFVYGDVL